MLLRERFSLTPRFYLIALLFVVTIITGMATGFALFYRLAYILCIATILSFLWNMHSVKSIDVHVDRRTKKVHVGDLLDERITARNNGLIPKPVITIEDLSEIPGYSSRRAVSLPSKGFRSWRTNSPAKKRGVYKMGPLRIRSTDALGLFEREIYFGETSEITVYPKILNLRSFNLPANSISGDSSVTKRTQILTPHAASVRDYAFGDSISRVHWNTTAKQGKLMSKEFDMGMSNEIWIFLDLQESVQHGDMDEGTDEWVVSIAASLAQKFSDANIPTGLVAYGDKRHFINASRGQGHFENILETMATAKSEGKTSLFDVIANEEALWTYQNSLIVITPSCSSNWARAIGAMSSKRINTTVILLDSQTFGANSDPSETIRDLLQSGIPTHLVQKGDNLESVFPSKLTASHGSHVQNTAADEEDEAA